MKTNNIKEIRLKRVMTQQQLAEKMGVQQQVISRWEQGLVYPEFQNMLKLSEALNSSVDELFVRGCKNVK